MENADESSSENNINVLGIDDYPESPHQVNKKAYFRKRLTELVPVTPRFKPPSTSGRLLHDGCRDFST